jgi:hypothetical protein
VGRPSLVTRTLPAVLLLTFACTASPYEQGVELGTEHAEMLRANELTFERFTHDLDEADREHPQPTAREEFRSGYSKAIEPVRAELIELVTARIATDAIDRIGATAGQLVDSVRAAIKKPDGELDRAKIRHAGREVGKLLRDFTESAVEFQKGIEEGLEKDDDR